jgi:DNA-nicking Smr family endonuclease
MLVCALVSRHETRVARPPKFPPHRPFRALAKATPAKAPAAPPDRAEVEAELVFARAAAELGVEAMQRDRGRVGAAERRRPPVVPPAPEFVVSEEEGWVEGYRRELGPRVIARLRGKPRATLDLHGARVASAKTKVASFVARARAGSVVLIVVGKGRHSPDGQAVLAREIGVWLSTGLPARRVLAFCTAPPELGGSGGVLVLLAALTAE